MNKPTGSLQARRDENLRRAREAEYQAELVGDGAARALWLRIAQTYVELATLIPIRPKVF